MRKKRNKDKSSFIFKALSVAFLVLLTFNTKAIVISDTDDEAFMTKSEFDSLKNDFELQMSTYNANLDSKIDVAISNYLAGITVNKEPTELWSGIMYSTNNKFRWASFNLPESSPKADIVNNTIVNVTRYHNHPECLAYTGYRAHGSAGSSAQNGVIYQLAVTQSLANAVTDQLLARAYRFACGTYVNEYTSWTDYTWVKHDLSSSNKSNTFYDSKNVTNGKGKLFDFNILPNGNIELKKYNSTAFINNNIEIIGYSYKDNYTNPSSSWANFQAVYCAAGGANYTTAININIPKGEKYKGGSVGNIPTNKYNSTVNWNYGNQNIAWNKIDDGIDYSFYYWGTNTNQVAYGVTNESELDWDSAEQKTGYGTGTSASTDYLYKRVYWPCTGDTTEDVKISNISYSYYEPKVEPYYTSLNNIENQYVSDQIAEAIYHGEGAPIFKSSDDESKIKVKDIVIKLYDVNNPTQLKGGDVRVMISLDKFSNGNFRRTQDKLYDKTVTIPSSGTYTLSMTDEEAFTIEHNKTTCWMNVYDTAGTGLVAIESLNPVLVKDS